MKIKQKIVAAMLTLASGLSVGTLAAPLAYAETCAGVTTAIIHCDQKGGQSTSARDSGVWGVLLIALNIMTAGVGILAVGGIVYGSILYASASDRAEQTKQAIDIIRNVVIGIAAYGVMYLVLNFLIPGGIFT